MVTASNAGRSTEQTTASRWWNRIHLGPLLGLLLIAVVLSFASDRFLTASNLLNVARQVSINALLAVGATFVILTGGIDLSVGSVLALAGALAAGWMQGGLSPLAAVVGVLLVGLAAGLVNGAFVAYGRVAPFIATLGTMTLYRGLTLIYTQGRPISSLPDSFYAVGGGYLGPVPTPVWIMAIVFVAGWLVLNRMTPGRRILAIGGNEEAAVLSGIRTDRYKLLVYGISGSLSALAGVVLTSRLHSAQPTAGIGYELDAIAAVVLGGTSLSGGRGSLWGTLVGAFIIGVIDNGLNLLNVSSFYQQAVKGAVILAAVLMDRRR